MRLGNTDTELPRRSTDPPAPCHRNMFCPFLKKCFSVPEVCLLIVTKMHCSTDDKVLVLINAQNASGDHLYLCLCHGCHGQLTTIAFVNSCVSSSLLRRSVHRGCWSADPYFQFPDQTLLANLQTTFPLITKTFILCKQLRINHTLWNLDKEKFSNFSKYVWPIFPRIL